jgi:hypothetical protein
MKRARRLGKAANRTAENVAARVDATSPEVTHRLARLLALAVLVLRWPSLALWAIPWPFILVTLAVATAGSGGLRIIGLAVGLTLAAVSVAFGMRRRAIIAAVDDRAELAAELQTALNLSSRFGEATLALEQIAGTGGWRVFSRLWAMWRSVSLPARWVEQIGDLPRARYFVPPKIGTTVALAYAAVWLVPVSVAVAIIAVVMGLARLV